MHVAFVVQPAYGHVIPTLPLVAELVRRGHRVSYATGPDLVDQAKAVGAEGVAIPTFLPALPPDRATFRERGLAELGRHALDDATEHFPVLRRHFTRDRPDLVCFDMLTFTGQMLTHVLGTPGVALVPNFAANESISLAEWTMGSGFVPGAALRELDRDRAAFAVRNGVLADLDALGGRAVAPLNLVFLPREFQVAADTFDDRFRFLGPMLGRLDTGESWEPDASGRPVLYISLGTAFNTDVEFYRRCLDAFGGGPWQVVMAVGHRIERTALGVPPDNVDVRPFVPQHDVLRHAAAHISHTGMNSTMESLALGVPLVAVPQMPEQEANARRIEDLGLGVRLDPAAVTGSALAAAVERVVSDPSIAAAVDAMRRLIGSCGGAVAGADAIEAYHLRTRRRELP